jgi:hypothetical protein
LRDGWLTPGHLVIPIVTSVANRVEWSMTTPLQRNQFSIAGLLFVTLGMAIFFSVAPYLYTVAMMSPPWSVFVLIMLLFSWCMIPLRTGHARAWWIGFLAFGSLYLAFALLAEPEETLRRLALRVGQMAVVFGVVIASLLLALGSGLVGGFCFRGIHHCLRGSCKKTCGDSVT